MTSRKNYARFAAMSRARASLRVAALCAAFFGMTSIASADVIQISATAFALRTAAGSSDVAGEGGLGLLQNAKGSYFAAVAFPTTGNVCRFNLVYRDFDADFQIIARLMKKKIAIGGSAFVAPVVMAALRTGKATASDTVARRSTAAITEPTIAAPGTAFYFVQLFVPATTLQVLGVEIVVKPTCP